MFKKIALAAVMAVAATSSFAADRSRVYIGGDVGRSSIDDYDDTLTSVGVFGGYRFNNIIAIEGGLRRLGSDDDATGDQASVSAVFTGYAKGEWDRISLFARVGVNYVNFDKCGTICGPDTTRGLVGVGMGIDFTPRITGRIEYQRPTNKTSNLSVGVAFGF